MGDRRLYTPPWNPEAFRFPIRMQLGLQQVDVTTDPSVLIVAEAVNNLIAESQKIGMAPIIVWRDPEPEPPTSLEYVRLNRRVRALVSARG